MSQKSKAVPFEVVILSVRKERSEGRNLYFCLVNGVVGEVRGRVAFRRGEYKVQSCLKVGQ